MREKIAKFIVFIRSDQQKEVLSAKIKQLPVDQDKPIQVVISEKPNKRSNPQNSYYWMRLGEIATQAYVNGRLYNSDCWHEELKRNHMPEIIIDKNGVKRSKWTETPSGDLVVISTTELGVESMAEYTTIIEAYGAGELGVMFSDIRNG